MFDLLFVDNKLSFQFTSDREVLGLDLGVPSYSGLQILKYELHVQILTSVSIVSRFIVQKFTIFICSFGFKVRCMTMKPNGFVKNVHR